MELLTERYGKIVCMVLVVVDLVLGGTAVFFPYSYAEIFHPGLTTPPIDFIVRTGILWLGFAFFQGVAAFSKNPQRWFFVVSILRLMDVPADIIYGILAMGATMISRIMIWSAPLLNTLFGLYLLTLSQRLKEGREA